MFKDNNINSPIGQGTMGFGGYFQRDESNDEQFIDALLYGLKLGMNFIDTAENYGAGHSEEIVGKAIKDKRDSVFVATKVSPEHLKFKDVIKSCEASLQRLQTDYIDLYQIHWPNPAIPLDETLEALTQLRKDGKIRNIGVSNFSCSQLKEANGILGNIPLYSIQVEYNLFDRYIENEILPYCVEHDISVIAYSPLDQGNIVKKSNILSNLADKYNKNTSQIALSWLISHKNVIAIPKAAKHDHIQLNASVADFNLEEDDLKAIDIECKSESINVDVNMIKVVLDDTGNRKVYQTIEDALKNELHFTPSPAQLADDLLKRGEQIKPVRVKLSIDNSRYKYDLIEGRIRYWAWVIAHKGEKPIPVLIRE